MKLQIKDVLRQLTFIEFTMLCLPPRKVPTKGVMKRGKSNPNEASISRIPSSWEHVDFQLSDGQLSPTSSSFSIRKGAHIDNS